MRYNILLFIVILQHFRCGYEWASLLVCVCVGGGGGRGVWTGLGWRCARERAFGCGRILTPPVKTKKDL